MMELEEEVRFQSCPSCGSAHLPPVPCNLSFRDRMRSVRLDGSVTATQTKANYWDREAVAQTFGEDSRERMLDDTRGLGYVRTDEEGKAWHRDRNSGEVVPLSEKEADQVMLGGDTEVIV